MACTYLDVKLAVFVGNSFDLFRRGGGGGLGKDGRLGDSRTWGAELERESGR
jgi:hypothetical protein